MDIGVCVGIYCGQKEEEEIKKDERWIQGFRLGCV